jgi:hypothetical protein
MRGDQGVPRLRISGATTEQGPYQQGARKRETDETEYILHHNPPCAYTRFEPDYARHDAVISACRANDGYTRPATRARAARGRTPDSCTTCAACRSAECSLFA